MKNAFHFLVFIVLYFLPINTRPKINTIISSNTMVQAGQAWSSRTYRKKGFETDTDEYYQKVPMIHSQVVKHTEAFFFLELTSLHPLFASYVPINGSLLVLSSVKATLGTIWWILVAT